MAVAPTSPYVILKPLELGDSPMPNPEGFPLVVCEEDPDTFNNYLDYLSDNKEATFALDIETQGNEAHNPDSYVVGVGLCNCETMDTIYLSFKSDNGQEYWDALVKVLGDNNIPLMVYNMVFDGAYCLRSYGSHLNFIIDVYAYFREIANEGWHGQRYGLKVMQTDLLRWKHRGDVILSEYLKANKLKKADMAQAPDSILGPYCCLDAYSTAEAYKKIISPALDKFPKFEEMHKLHINLAELTIEQQLIGMKIDTERLHAEYKRYEEDYKSNIKLFLDMPSVRDFINKKKEPIIQKLMIEEPAPYKTVRLPPKEPTKNRKDGGISVAWCRWVKKVADYERKKRNPIVSGAWLSWSARIAKANKDSQYIGPDSNDKLIEFFYKHLKKPVDKLTKSSKRYPEGRPSVDKDMLPKLGPEGELLFKIKKKGTGLKQMRGIIKAVENSRDGQTLNTQWKVPGTFTGRCSGAGGVSLHNQDKSLGYMKCFRARPGYVLVDTDVSALEPCVLTQASGDKAMWSLYGPDAKPNDVYLFNAAHSKLGDPLRKLGYDPYNPCPKAIAKCKKKHKDIRNLFKLLTLSCDYGAGKKSNYDNAIRKGFKVTFEEIEELWNGMQDLYIGKRKYMYFLQNQWEKNGGWFLGPMGLPICVAEERLKDCVNRAIQRSGHQILMISILFLRKHLDESGIEWHPWIIDFHDESIIEVKYEDKEIAMECFRKAYKDLNETLNGDIVLKGEPDWGYSLAAFKVPDDYNREEDKHE